MRTIAASFLLPFVLLCAGLAQNSSHQLIQEALKASPLESNLQSLTDRIGGRVPGTPAMEKAVQWGVDAFQAAGADSVHKEKFSIQTSWAEGSTEMSISAPETFKLRVVSIAWGPALAPQHHVRVVDVGNGNPEDFARAGNVAGAILLVHSDEMKTWSDLFFEYTRAPGIIDQAVKGKALALAFQSTRPHDLLYRHTNADAGEIDVIPSVIVAREDASRVIRLLAAGEKLEADLSIPNRIGGPITSTNVIAEIKGSENPDEFVVLGAHLDSWELGTGALDNGCNAALVVDALRAIKASGLRPRRSIRFILFSGEEEGLIGSRSYVDAHRAELDNAAGVVIFDSGIGHVTGFSLGGRKDLVDNANPLVASLKQFDATKLTVDADAGTDNLDFLLQGVPTFVANQVEGNYLINYHAMSDTFDKIDIAELKTHVAEAATLAFALANADGRVGPRLHRVQIEQTLRETHLDDEMKGFGIWPDWESGKRGRKD